MSRATAADPLTRLLHLHWRGGVDQAQAAKLVGIRKDEFAELAALRKCLLIVERAVWRYYLARFNFAFPECDRMAMRRAHPSNAPVEVRRYTDIELLTPPNPEVFRSSCSGCSVKIGRS